MNRYTRDELIKIGLNMAQIAGLETHDMPNGVVQPNALSIQWIHDIIDWWYHVVPFSVTVSRVGISCIANQNYITMPSDFILDVRNGLKVETIPGDTQSLRRAKRIDYQKFLTWEDYHQRSVNVKYPVLYCVLGRDSSNKQLMLLTPTPNIATQGMLSYYALPPKLKAGDIPSFPADKILIEYIRIRALEFSRIYDPGTSEKYCERLLVAAKASGLMNEPESDDVPMDDLQYRNQNVHGQYTPYAWMGPV